MHRDLKPQNILFAPNGTRVIEVKTPREPAWFETISATLDLEQRRHGADQKLLSAELQVPSHAHMDRRPTPPFHGEHPKMWRR